MTVGAVIDHIGRPQVFVCVPEHFCASLNTGGADAHRIIYSEGNRTKKILPLSGRYGIGIIGFECPGILIAGNVDAVSRCLTAVIGDRIPPVKILRRELHQNGVDMLGFDQLQFRVTPGGGFPPTGRAGHAFIVSHSLTVDDVFLVVSVYTIVVEYDVIVQHQTAADALAGSFFRSGRGIVCTSAIAANEILGYGRSIIHTGNRVGDGQNTLDCCPSRILAVVIRAACTQYTEIRVGYAGSYSAINRGCHTLIPGAVLIIQHGGVFPARGHVHRGGPVVEDRRIGGGGISHIRSLGNHQLLAVYIRGEIVLVIPAACLVGCFSQFYNQVGGINDQNTFPISHIAAGSGFSECRNIGVPLVLFVVRCGRVPVIAGAAGAGVLPMCPELIAAHGHIAALDRQRGGGAMRGNTAQTIPAGNAVVYRQCGAATLYSGRAVVNKFAGICDGVPALTIF